jgi:thioredoxin-like negative regulator of GroEL
VEQLAIDYSGKFRFVQVVAPDNMRLVQSYRIQAMPTLVLFQNGQPKASLIGRQSREAIEQKLLLVQ